MMKTRIAFTAILYACFATLAVAKISPVQLTCEYISNPLGIEDVNPELSWLLESSERDQHQSAYEILVADNLSDLQQLKGSLWTSGKVQSSENINIPYNGQPLRSRTRYFWKVRVYDQNNEPSAWSEPVWFETAMLQPADWKAKWIGDGSKQPEKDEDYYKPDRMPLFRKEFNVDKTVRSARLYISGVGYYEAFLNGKKISDHMLDPGWTTYRKQVLYVVHDITSMIGKGKNAAGIMLGSGWWNPLPFKFFGRWDLREYQQTGRPCVKAEIQITYTDGSKSVVATDDSWKTAPGPIIQNNVYLGEHYDARLEQKNWNTLAAQTASWKNASITEGPSGRLTVQMQPPIRITRIVKPVKITEPKPGIFIVDMGQNFAGVARIKVKGKAGTKITLRYGEGVFDDGSINIMTTAATQIKKGGIKGGPGAPETAWQEDNYTLNGQGTEVWFPRFTFHGFQYVEITGWTGKPTLNDIEGLRMNSDLPVNGTFSCSNEMFNRLHDVIQWTFLSNIFSVQSDCPGREKMGYGADMVVSANAFIYNYDMANFYHKALQDFANEQQPDGGITEIAPFTGIADRGYGGYSGPLGWQLGFPFLQKQLYDYYGDKSVLEEYYPAFKHQMEFLQAKAVEGLFHWDISDHESIDTKPEAFTASSFYYHHALLAAEFAGILDQKDDSIKYAVLAKNIKRNILSRYWVKNTGRFDMSTQAAQIFALWYDLTPERELTMNVLKQEFTRHRNHVASGIFGTKMMFDVLRESDEPELAYQIANQRDFPGWGHMVTSGASTLWESWDFPETGASRNHPMFGSVDEWFYRSLLGINPGAPGFSKIIIKPQPAGDLTAAKGSYQSVRGKITSEWKIEGNTFTLQVTLPPNTTAEVWIPTKENTTVTESDKPISNTRKERGHTVIIAGSGTYAFKAINN